MMSESRRNGILHRWVRMLRINAGLGAALIHRKVMSRQVRYSYLGSYLENVMNTHAQSAHSAIWYLAIATLLIAALMFVATRPAAQSPAAGKTEAFSFDMWCLEMQLYPAVRCDARRSEDVKAYERYRAATEKNAAQRAFFGKRDQELKDRLNQGPGDVKH
jgi:hypothetical protein